MTFVAVTLAMFLPIILTKRAGWSADLIFHYQRLLNVAHGGLMYNDFAGAHGVADQVFYPWLTIAPLTLLVKLGVSPVAIIDTWILASIFIGLNAAYYAYSIVYPYRIHAFSFAVLYIFSDTSITMVYPRSALPALLATLLAPLAFFGWLKVMKHGSPLTLVIGMTLLMYTHEVTFLLMSIALAVLTVMSAKRLDKRNIASLLKSAGLTLLLTAFYWLPATVLMSTNHLSTPELKIPMKRDASILNFSVYGLNDLLTDFMGVSVIVMLAVVLTGWTHQGISWKRLSFYPRICAIVALLLVLCNIHFLPWSSIQKTFVKAIQFPHRVSFIVQMFSAYAFIRLIAYHWKSKRTSQTARMCGVLFILLLSGLIMIAQNQTIRMGMTNNIESATARDIKAGNPLGHIKGLGKHNSRDFLINRGYVTMTSHELRQPCVVHLIPNADYLTHGKRGYGTPSKHLKIKFMHGDQIRVRTNRTLHNARLPIEAYHAQPYQVEVNGKRIHASAKEGHLAVKTIRRGRHQLTVHAPVPLYWKLGLSMSMLGIVVLAAARVCERRRQ